MEKSWIPDPHNKRSGSETVWIRIQIQDAPEYGSNTDQGPQHCSQHYPFWSGLYQNQCCGSGTIYSGSGSSSEFSEFRIRIQAKVPDRLGSGSNPCYLSIFGNCNQNHLKFNHKEESIIQLPFSISCYSPTVHKVQNSEKLHFYLSALSYLAGSGSGTIIPDPGKSSTTLLSAIYNLLFFDSLQ